MAGGSKKKERSNQQRLKAIHQKQESSKRVSIKLTPIAKRTVFSDSSSSEQDEQTASSKAKPLPLFNLSGSDSELDEETFAEKKQFSGRSGEKLFRLQQRIGTDERFRLDEKFAEESSSEASDRDETNMEVGDEVSTQLEREKTNALSIIDSILGKDTSHQHTKSRTNTKLVQPADLFPLRYDPEATNHSDFEQPNPKAAQLPPSPTKEDSSETSSEAEEEDQPNIEQESLKKKYFTIHSDLKELFSTTDNNEGGFKFFDDGPNVDGVEDTISDNKSDSGTKAAEEQTVKERKKHISKKKASDETSESTQDSQQENITSRPRLLFFFHDDSPTLRNRLDENTFYRTKSLKELEQNWPAKRTAMKQLFKKRRKEALKHSKKKFT